MNICDFKVCRHRVISEFQACKFHILMNLVSCGKAQALLWQNQSGRKCVYTCKGAPYTCKGAYHSGT